MNALSTLSLLLPKLLAHLPTWPFPRKPGYIIMLSAPVHPSLPFSSISKESMKLCISKTFYSVLLCVYGSLCEWVWACKCHTAHMKSRGPPQMPALAFHLVWNMVSLIFFTVLQATQRASGGSPVLCLPCSGIVDAFYHGHFYMSSRDLNLGLSTCAAKLCPFNHLPSHLFLTLKGTWELGSRTSVFNQPPPSQMKCAWKEPWSAWIPAEITLWLMFFLLLNWVLLGQNHDHIQ